VRYFFYVLIIVIISASHIGTSLADGPIDSLSIQISQSTISIDSFGSTSIDDKAITYKVFATSIINKNLAVEYGFMNLGKYKASYDITAGKLQFIESHTIDFSKTMFASLKLGTSINDMQSPGADVSPHNMPASPSRNDFYLSVKAGILLWQANLDMEGRMYDSGSLYDTYGASSDDNGFSTFYGIGIERGFSNNLIVGLNWDLYNKVGEGAKLKNIDGSTQKYSGRSVESIGLTFTYVF